MGRSWKPWALVISVVLGIAPVDSSAVGIERFISTDISADKFHAGVAFNPVHDEYMVVWHNAHSGGVNRDVYARRLDNAGRLLSWFAVSPAGGQRFQPELAFNFFESQYLIVWMRDMVGDGSRYAIYGKIILHNMPGTNPEIAIADFVNVSCWNPNVAYNSYRNEYLVTYDTMDVGNTTAESVGWVRVSSTGGILGWNPVTTTNAPHQSDVVYNVAQDGYLVVWRRNVTATRWDVYGQRLAWDGAAVGSAFQVCSGADDDKQAPAVTTNTQDRYVVVWQQQVASTGSDWDVQGARVASATGAVTQMGTLSPSYDDETEPDVAWEGRTEHYRVVFSHHTGAPPNDFERIETYLVDHSGIPASFDVVQPDYAFWHHENPAIAASGTDFLVVYEGEGSTGGPVRRDIYGRLTEQLLIAEFETGDTSEWTQTSR